MHTVLWALRARLQVGSSIISYAHIQVTVIRIARPCRRTEEYCRRTKLEVVIELENNAKPQAMWRAMIFGNRTERCVALRTSPPCSQVAHDEQQHFINVTGRYPLLRSCAFTSLVPFRGGISISCIPLAMFVAEQKSWYDHLFAAP
jgi:hypothetical protein